MIRPEKSLSQNFLVDPGMIRKVIALCEIKKTDSILEIGPGKGALTTPLLKTEAKLLAIEKDPRLYTFLRETFAHETRLELKQQDILTFDLEQLATPPKWKVISNLPFQLTSPILGQFLPATHQIESCIFILQKEFADRVCASPGTKLFSHISLFSQFYAEVKELLPIPRTCFSPAPKIDCSLVYFRVKNPPEIHAGHFFELTKNAFNQKRKMLRKTLPYESTQVEQALSLMGLSPLSRPEDLSVVHWIELALTLSPEHFSPNPPDKK